MWLLIDDQRDIQADGVARSYWEAITQLRKTHWEGIYLDYCLGDVGEPTGLDVLHWAEHYNRLPNQVVVVSTHEAGKDALSAYLTANGYVYHDGVWSRALTPTN